MKHGSEVSSSSSLATRLAEMELVVSMQEDTGEHEQEHEHEQE